MTPRERMLAALAHEPVNRVPRFEIWIDALITELGLGNPVRAYAASGQDGVLMPSVNPPASRAWRTGVDAWGRVWRDGTYAGGVVDTDADLERFTPPLRYAAAFFDPAAVAAARAAYPDHLLFYGTHVGPFTMAYLGMGFERFFLRLVDDPPFVRRLLAARTAWAIALFRRAVALGAELIVLGDDAGTNRGPMIPPALWRELVLPYHREIVAALPVPVIWHSDGNIAPLLPMAVEAGFAGVHGLDPLAGMDLAEVRTALGRDLLLIGNVDVRVLCGDDLGAVRREVDRCLAQGGRRGYALASCNSIFQGMKPASAAEFFRYAGIAAGSEGWQPVRGKLG